MTSPAKPAVIAELPRATGQRLRIALETRPTRRVDIRVTVGLNAVSGVFTPSKTGVAVDADQLPALIEALQRAEVKARELGWIGGDQ